MRLPFERSFNATTTPMLEAGDVVELECAESTPPRKPNVDKYDDDELDGILRMFCMAPSATEANGRYYRVQFWKQQVS